MRIGIDRIFQRSSKALAKPTGPKQVTSLEELQSYRHDVRALSSIYVLGNTSTVTSSHPTIQLLLQRLKAHSKPGDRDPEDQLKIALCIEGGGMRGCCAAGMAAALNLLGLNDCIDLVYGSSAGAMIGAYFVSRQVSGTSIYSQLLPRAGHRFINKRKLLQAAGLPPNLFTNNKLKDFQPDKLKNFLANRWQQRLSPNLGPTLLLEQQEPQQQEKQQGRIPVVPRVINLEFLLDKVMCEMQGLDWLSFVSNEEKQPLHILATDVNSGNRNSSSSMEVVDLCRGRGSFFDLASLLNCIRASMLVPGITEPLMPLLHEEEGEGNHSDSRERRRVPRQAHHVHLFSHQLQQQVGKTVTSAVQPEAMAAIPSSEEEPEDDDHEEEEEIEEVEEDSKVIIEKHIRHSLLLLKHWLQRQPAPPQPTPQIAGDRPSRQPQRPAAASATAVDDRSPSHSLLCDAFLVEPMPYRSAVHHLQTIGNSSHSLQEHHVIVLRTRPDPCPVLGKKPGIFEQLIAKRFFLAYHQLKTTQPSRTSSSSCYQRASDWLLSLQHHFIYAQDILLMNQAAAGPSEGVCLPDDDDNSEGFICCPSPSSTIRMNSSSTVISTMISVTPPLLRPPPLPPRG